jgi:hypothetical protein
MVRHLQNDLRLRAATKQMLHDKGDVMLVLLAIICVVFLAYALTFDKIGDAVPQKVSDMFNKSTPTQTDDKNATL